MTADVTGHVILASYLTLAGDVVPEVRPGSQVSPYDIAHRIEAAVAAGYRGFGFALADLDYWGGVHGGARIRGWLDEAGIEVVELEMLHDWYANGERLLVSDAVAQRLLVWAEVLGATHLKIGTGFTGEHVDRSRLVGGLADLCAKAEAIDLSIALEPMPLATIRTPTEALALVLDAGAPNAGLLLDSWHVYRTGADYAALERIPAERIISLELIDGDADPVEGDLVRDSIDHRRLAGTGDFDLGRFLHAVFATGFTGPIGDENISIENRGRSLLEAAEANHAAVSAAVSRTFTTAQEGK